MTILITQYSLIRKLFNSSEKKNDQDEELKFHWIRKLTFESFVTFFPNKLWTVKYEPC